MMGDTFTARVYVSLNRCWIQTAILQDRMLEVEQGYEVGRYP